MERREQVAETSKKEQTLSRGEAYEALGLLDEVEEAVRKVRPKELHHFSISQEEYQQLRSCLQTLQDKVLKKIGETQKGVRNKVVRWNTLGD